MAEDNGEGRIGTCGESGERSGRASVRSAGAKGDKEGERQTAAKRSPGEASQS